MTHRLAVTVGGFTAVGCLAGFLFLARGQTERSVLVGGGYIPAIHYSSGPGANDDRVIVFPTRGSPVVLNLPFPLGNASFAPGGSALYGSVSRGLPLQRTYSDPGLYRLELSPVRTSLFIPASKLPFTMVGDIAVSADQKTLVTLAFGLHSNCGVFEVSLPAARIKKILDIPDEPRQPGCDTFGFWPGLSLSPGALEAMAVRKFPEQDYRLELIDLNRGTIRAVGTGFQSAFWSPDGKWIAAVEYSSTGRLRTTLLETKGYTRGRSFVTDRSIAWSPDSRYLLTFEESAACLLQSFGEAAQLATIDIATGKRTLVKAEPACWYGAAARLGWVRAEVAGSGN